MRFPSLPWLRRKASFGAQAVTHPAFGGGGWGGGDLLGRAGIVGALFPQSSVNWAEEVGDPSLNWVVAGSLRWIADNLPEPALQVADKGADGKWVPRATHAALDLLAEPNEDYDGDSLLAACAWDYALTGRAFVQKERDNLGRVRELWWRPWWMMRPVWKTKPGSKFIEGYLYSHGQGEPTFLSKEDVIHFRWGLDAGTGGRLGVHRTQPVLPAIASLNEGVVYTASVLRNMGIVPWLITSESELDVDARATLRDWFQNLFTRDGRGKPAVLTGGKTDIKQVGLSPQDLALDTILDPPALAVCLAFGIHPGVLHLAGAGGKGFDNGGQLREARQASYHDCLMPLTKRFGKVLTRQLLGEWERKPASQCALRFDFSEVEALAEDEDALHTRARENFQKGVMTRNEARELLGLPPVAMEAPGGDGATDLPDDADDAEEEPTDVGPL